MRPRSTMRRAGRWLPAATAIALLAAACGDDDDDAADTTSAGSPQSTAGSTEPAGSATTAGGSAPSGSEPAEPTGEPIKLMVIFDKETGLVTPEAPEGAIAAAEEINAAGGIGGRPIEILECDTKGDPTGAQECGQRAVSEGVVAAVGSLSAVGGGYLDVLAQNNIASIGNYPAVAEDFTSPSSFPLANAFSNIAGDAYAIQQAGATAVGVARVNFDAAAITAQWVNQILEPAGESVEQEILVPLGAPDMSSYAQSADGLDAVLIASVAQDAINLSVALKQLNPEVILALSSPDIENVVKQLTDAVGDAADGTIVATGTPWGLSGPGYQAFEESMAAAGFENTNGFFRINSYASVKAFADVAEDLPEVTAEAVFEALPAAGEIRTGVFPPISFAEGGVAGLPRAFSTCVVVMVARGGVLEPSSDTFIDPVTGEDCPNP